MYTYNVNRNIQYMYTYIHIILVGTGAYMLYISTPSICISLSVYADMCICTSHTSWGTEICKYIEYFLRGILRMSTRANRILTYLYVCISIVGNSSIYLYIYVHSGERREWTRANTSLSRMHCFTTTIRTDAFPFANFMSCILKTSSISIRHARCVTQAHAHAHTNIQAHTCIQTSTPTHKHIHSNTRTHRHIRIHKNITHNIYTHIQIQ